MSIVKKLFGVRSKPPIEVRQHRYRAPLRPKQNRVVRWTKSSISRPQDYDEVPNRAPIVKEPRS